MTNASCSYVVKPEILHWQLARKHKLRRLKVPSASVYLASKHELVHCDKGHMLFLLGTVGARMELGLSKLQLSCLNEYR